LEFLKYARSQVDYLVVALEPDARILQKRSIVIHTQKQRGMMLAPYVDTTCKLKELPILYILFELLLSVERGYYVFKMNL
jgi:glycerol-3-phosphate cytidylyltransferase-like family protein